MCGEIVAGLFGPFLEQNGQCVDRSVHCLPVSVPILEDRHEVISASDEPSVYPSDVLKEAERVLHVGGLHQLAGSLGDADVGGGGPAPQGTYDVGREAYHFSGWTARSWHLF